MLSSVEEWAAEIGAPTSILDGMYPVYGLFLRECGENFAYSEQSGELYVRGTHRAQTTPYYYADWLFRRMCAKQYYSPRYLEKLWVQICEKYCYGGPKSPLDRRTYAAIEGVRGEYAAMRGFTHCKYCYRRLPSVREGARRKTPWLYTHCRHYPCPLVQQWEWGRGHEVEKARRMRMPVRQKKFDGAPVAGYVDFRARMETRKKTLRSRALKEKHAP